VQARKKPMLKTIAQLVRRESLLLIFLLLISALVLLFLGVAGEVREGETGDFDRWIIQLFRDPLDHARPLGPPWLVEAMRDVTSLGSTVVLATIVILVVVYLLIVRKYAMALLVAAAVIGGQVMSTLVKLTIDRPRPDFPDWAPLVFTPSFPSGHAMLSAVTYLTLGVLLARAQPTPILRIYFVAVAIFLTLSIGISRVYLGVHWPTDVIAGWSVGSAWALTCGAVALWLQERGTVEKPSGPTPP
jgi:undecaprenyl-diphosphatase